MFAAHVATSMTQQWATQRTACQLALHLRTFPKTGYALFAA